MADKPTYHIPRLGEEPLGMREHDVLLRELEEYRAKRAAVLAERERVTGGSEESPQRFTKAPSRTPEADSAERTAVLGEPEREASRDQEPPRRLSKALGWVPEVVETVTAKREENSFYVYVHRHPTTNIVFYVGKGVDARAWTVSERRPEHTERLHRFLAEGHTPGSWVSLVKWGLTEAEALSAEDQLIRELTSQGIDLVNRRKPGPPIAERDLPHARNNQGSKRLALVREMKGDVRVVLDTIPPEQSYIPMWVLLRMLKIGLGKAKREAAITEIRDVFVLGIRGWYLDEDLYIRRGTQAVSN